MIFSPKTFNLRFGGTVLLLLACVLFGGSASIPLYEMVLSILALSCLLVVSSFRTPPKTEGPFLWLILSLLLLFVIQVMPLPNVVWILMPQGQFAESFLSNSKLKGMWQTMSNTPDATLYSLIAAAPALITLWLASGLTQSQRLLIANILVLAALFQALIGIAQAAGALPFAMYEYRHPKVAIGLFASRNHFADLILIGTSLMYAVRNTWSVKYGSAFAEIIFHTFLLVFLIAMIGSASRAGVVLFSILVFVGYIYTIPRYRIPLFLVGTSIIMAAAWAILHFLPQTGVIKTTSARFAMADDGRWDIWVKSFALAQALWPWGSGLGGFRQSYENFENLQDVKPSYINSAHNEYVQFIVETGLLGIIVLMTISIIILKSIRKINVDSLNVLSLFGLFAILLHAFGDYPFRVIGINALVGCLFAFILFDGIRAQR